MSYQRPPRSNVGALLKEAQIAVGESVDVHGGKIYKLDPGQCDGRRALVFDDRERGVTVGIRVEIPTPSALRNLSLTSPAALSLLGALTLALQAHNAEAKLLTGQQGLEALMLSARICGDADSAALTAQLNSIQRIVQSIEPLLSLSGRELIDAVIHHLRPQISAAAKESLATAQPIIVPTFDEAARNRMMQQIGNN